MTRRKTLQTVQGGNMLKRRFFAKDLRMVSKANLGPGCKKSASQLAKTGINGYSCDTVWPDVDNLLRRGFLPVRYG